MNLATRRMAKPFPAVFVAALLLGVALNPVNSTLISTALEPIATDLGVTSGSTQILIVSLYLACTVAQPTAGKLSELIGPRRVLLAGCLFVLVGGLLGGISATLTGLIVARVIIGIGTSAGYPASMYLVRRRALDFGFESAPKGILAALAIVGLALMAVGPPLGGLLVSAFGWRSTFFVDIPVALACGLLTLIGVPPDEKAVTHVVHFLVAELDLAGIAGFVGFMVLFLFFLLSIPQTRWMVGASSLALALGFIGWELHTRRPFLDVRELSSNGPLLRTFLRAMMTMLGSYVVLYALPQWLEAAHGCSSEIAGLSVVPMGIISAAASTWISKRGVVRRPFIAAGLAMLIGGGALACASASNLLLCVCVTASALGVTLGGNIAAGQLALYDQVEPEHTGTAAGLLRTFTYFGSIAASVIAGIIFQQAATDAGMHLIGFIVMGLGVVVALITVFDRRLR